MFGSSFACDLAVRKRGRDCGFVVQFREMNPANKFELRNSPPTNSNYGSGPQEGSPLALLLEREDAVSILGRRGRE